MMTWDINKYICTPSIKSLKAGHEIQLVTYGDHATSHCHEQIAYCWWHASKAKVVPAHCGISGTWSNWAALLNI